MFSRYRMYVPSTIFLGISFSIFFASFSCWRACWSLSCFFVVGLAARLAQSTQSVLWFSGQGGKVRVRSLLTTVSGGVYYYELFEKSQVVVLCKEKVGSCSFVSNVSRALGRGGVDNRAVEH